MIHTEELNAILEKNYSAVSGYDLALEKVESSTLTSVFKSKQINRKKFIDDLSMLLRAKGIEPSKSGSTLGNLHRFIMEITTEWTDEQEQSVIKECIRGEENLLNEYKDLLKEELDSEVSVLITDHATDLQATVNELKELHEIGEQNKAKVNKTNIPMASPATPAR